MLCVLLNGGVTEVLHDFDNLGGKRRVRLDCETPTHVIEVGLDNTASARDSVHQALFAEFLTGKTPMIVVIDTDGVEDRYQYEARIVAARAGVAYAVCSKHFIQRWAATSYFRGLSLDKSLNDLPVNAAAALHCDLVREFAVPVP